MSLLLAVNDVHSMHQAQFHEEQQDYNVVTYERETKGET